MEGLIHFQMSHCLEEGSSVFEGFFFAMWSRPHPYCSPLLTYCWLWSSISTPYLVLERPTLVWKDSTFLYVVDERYYMLGGHSIGAIPFGVFANSYTGCLACELKNSFGLFALSAYLFVKTILWKHLEALVG